MPLATGTFLTLAALVLPEGSGGLDPFSGAVPVVRYSFANDEDQDFDSQPDDWSRRRGAGFPTYIETGIDRTQGRSGGQSLRFLSNGGQATMYSPPVRIEPLHSYVFEGYVRTQELQHDAAVVSVSFLNHRRQRVQRFLTRPVSGTHHDWVRVRIGPVAPREDVRFVVIGCHLACGRKSDIRGTAWFDDLSLGRLPQLSLVTNFETQFRYRGQEIDISARMSGLDDGHTYRLHLELTDGRGRLVAGTTRPIEPQQPESEPTGSGSVPVHTVNWTLQPQDYGYYHVRAMLHRDGEPLLHAEMSFAVLDPAEGDRSGEFGWTVADPTGALSLQELVQVGRQAGVNWMKFPLWQSVSDDQAQAAEVAEMLDLLTHRGITPVGLLNDPPPELRRQFARDWRGVAEIFTMSPRFWSASMEPVIARHSANVRHWQLGDDGDGSFAGMTRLPETLAAVRREFDRIGRDPQLGIPWDWTTPMPPPARLPHSFLSLTSDQRLAWRDIQEKLKQSAGAGLPRWVVLKPLPASQHSDDERGTDLIRRMLAAKIGGADAIFAHDVFDSEHGLLTRDGSPTLLFLPWRTTALALRGTRFLGSLHLPQGSRNYVFAHDDEVVLFVWNDQPTTEELYLGEQVTAIDLWGRRRTVPTTGSPKRQAVAVGPAPLILRGCSAPVARWRLAVQFEHGRVESRYGGHQETIRGQNTFSQGVSGQVSFHVPPEWQVEPRSRQVQMGAAEAFTFPVRLTLPANASLGTELTSIDFDLVADRPYRFSVFRPYKVGLDDIDIELIDRRLPDGRLEIEQIITNRTEPAEVLNLRCSLFVPGMKRQKQIVTKLGSGQDRKFYYLPDADTLRGEELWLRAEQVGGTRVVNYKWTVGSNWEDK